MKKDCKHRGVGFEDSHTQVSGAAVENYDLWWEVGWGSKLASDWRHRTPSDVLVLCWAPVSRSNSYSHSMFSVKNRYKGLNLSIPTLPLCFMYYAAFPAKS